jgi:putative transposase
MEERRLAAGRLLRAGKLSQAEVAREVGVSRASVTRWKQRLACGGLRALRRRRAPGRASRLTAAQWRRLGRVLDRGAVAAGFGTGQWTLPRIGAVIERVFGVRYNPRSLGPALRGRGFSPQRPVPRAAERVDALVEAWLERDWERVKRGPAEAGAPLPSWTRRVTRFGPASPRRGRAGATHRS